MFKDSKVARYQEHTRQIVIDGRQTSIATWDKTSQSCREYERPPSVLSLFLYVDQCAPLFPRTSSGRTYNTYIAPNCRLFPSALNNCRSINCDSIESEIDLLTRPEYFTLRRVLNKEQLMATEDVVPYGIPRLFNCALDLIDDDLSVLYVLAPIASHRWSHFDKIHYRSTEACPPVYRLAHLVTCCSGLLRSWSTLLDSHGRGTKAAHPRKGLSRKVLLWKFRWWIRLSSLRSTLTLDHAETDQIRERTTCWF